MLVNPIHSNGTPIPVVDPVVSVEFPVVSGTFGSLGSGTQVSLETAQALTSGSVGTTLIWFLRYSAGWFTLFRGVFDILPQTEVFNSGRIVFSDPFTVMVCRTASLFALNREIAGTTSPGDYDNFGDLLSAESVFDEVNNTVTFELNATGLDYVGAGYVAFMVRDKADVDVDSGDTQSSAEFPVYRNCEGVFERIVENTVLFSGDYTQVVESGGFVSELINQGGSLDNPTEVKPTLQPILDAKGLLFNTQTQKLRAYLQGGQIFTEFTAYGWIETGTITQGTALCFVPIISCWNVFRNNSGDAGFRIGLNVNNSTDGVEPAFAVANGVKFSIVEYKYDTADWNANYINKRHFIAATFKDGMFKLYFNGVLIKTAISSLGVTTMVTDTLLEYYEVGRCGVNNSTLLNSITRYVAGAGVESRELTATEIYNLSKSETFSNNIYQGDYTNVVESGGLVSVLPNQSEYSTFGNFVQSDPAKQLTLTSTGLLSSDGLRYMEGFIRTTLLNELTVIARIYLPLSEEMTGPTKYYAFFGDYNGAGGWYIRLQYAPELNTINFRFAGINTTGPFSVGPTVATPAAWDSQFGGRWHTISVLFKKGVGAKFTISGIKYSNTSANTPISASSTPLSIFYSPTRIPAPATSQISSLYINTSKSLSATEIYNLSKNRYENS